MGVAWLCVCIALLATPAVVRWFASEPRKVRRALKEAPLVAIAAFPDGGTARVAGRATPIQPALTAPLSGRPCVYYEVIVDEYDEGWSRLVHEAAGVRFAIEDDTGRAIVDPTHVRIDLRQDHKEGTGLFRDADALHEDFLARHGHTSNGYFANKTIRYRESAITVGERVNAFGGGVREPDPEAVRQVAGYREAPPTRLRLSGAPGMPLLLSDDPDLVREALLLAEKAGVA